MIKKRILSLHLLCLNDELCLKLEDVLEVTEVSLEVDDDVGEEADVDERPVRDLGQDAQVGVVVGAKVLLLASSKTMQHNFLLKRKCCSNRVWRCHEWSC